MVGGVHDVGEGNKFENYVVTVLVLSIAEYARGCSGITTTIIRICHYSKKSEGLIRLGDLLNKTWCLYTHIKNNGGQEN